jgi:hypothetical protein
MLKDVLSQEGIVATINGASLSALYGAAGVQFAPIHLQVEEENLRQARELIEALEHEESELVDPNEEAEFIAAEVEKRKELPVDSGGAGPYRRPQIQAAPLRPRSKFVAGGLALVITFGSGHFYAGKKRVGAALLLAEVVAVFVGFREPLAHLALPLVMLVDLAGSIGAVERANRALLTEGS